MTYSLLSVLVGSLVSLGCLIGAFFALRRKRLIDDLPTSKAQGVFIGLVELRGTAESENPLTSYLAETRCVQYVWKVDEHWSRTVVETYTDDKGHPQTRTRTESGWTGVAGGSQSIPFYLKDETGVIRVVPEGANINGITVFDQTCSPNSDLYFGKGPAHEVANSTHQRRFHETVVPLHSMLYIIGQAREREDIVAAEIAHDKNAPMFLISTRTERQVSRRYALSFWLWSILGLLAAIGGAIGYSMLETGSIVWQPLVTAAGAFIVAMLLGWIWAVYNSLINLRNMVGQGESQVDVQLRRRHDLIPNLVRAIEGYRTHESETQKLLADIRTQMEATLPGEPGPDPAGIAPMLNIIVERYPELKASESFLQLQQALADTEQRIALARDYFNNIATFYNIRLDIIPDRFVAAIARLRPQGLLAAADFERAPVHIQLVS
jgi:hypothetical protein